LEFPEHPDGGQEWQPEIVRELEGDLTIGIVLQIVVSATHIVAIENIGDFEKRRNCSVTAFESAADARIDACVRWMPFGVPRPGNGDGYGLTGGIR
jgi:hypothetical protein